VASRRPPSVYTGQQQEAGAAALGAYNYNARFYSTTLGRFLSVDPIASGGPQGLNAYSYVRNNPLRYVDPTGMFTDVPGDSVPGCDAECGAERVRRAEEREKAEAARRTGAAELNALAQVGWTYEEWQAWGMIVYYAYQQLVGAHSTVRMLVVTKERTQHRCRSLRR
jgi:RHS repeat-associated protein